MPLTITGTLVAPILISPALPLVPMLILPGTLASTPFGEPVLMLIEPTVAVPLPLAVASDVVILMLPLVALPLLDVALPAVMSTFPPRALPNVLVLALLPKIRTFPPNALPFVALAVPPFSTA